VIGCDFVEKWRADGNTPNIGPQVVVGTGTAIAIAIAIRVDEGWTTSHSGAGRYANPVVQVINNSSAV
jgi:hypothetical protein